MSDSILMKLADEALKPSSSIVNALLAPKITQLQAWATERDIKSRINGKKLEAAFASYLRRLLKKVSYQTTIIFPQQALSLPAIYEPLTLMRRYQNIDISITNLCQQGARTFIVDDAGMGKSTFAKHLVLDQLGDTDRIPLLIELRRVENNQTLMDAIAVEMDSFGDAFDRQVLPLLISSGRFVIVLDGFDEVSTQDMAKRGREIEELASKGEDSIIFMTSRPNVELPAMPESTVVQFRPLSRKQSISLLHRYDQVSGLDVGQRLVRELASVPERFLETPLLVALLYRTFGFTGSISKRVSSFYESIYEALYKGHDLTKVGFSREKKSALDVEEFRRLLRGFAFLMVAKQVESFTTESNAILLIEEAVKLTSVQPSSGANFLNDLLVSVPLMFRDGNELRFLHKTIYEFFAAEYLSSVREGESRVAKVLDGPLLKRFLGTFDFLAELNPSLFRRSIAGPLAAEICGFSYPTNDIQFNTVLFAYKELGIIVWTEEDIVETIGADGRRSRSIKRSMPEWKSNSIGFSWGHVEGKEYVIGVALGEEAHIYPPAAWNLVTDAVDNRMNRRGAKKPDFAKIVSLSTPQTWYVFDSASDSNEGLSIFTGCIELQSELFQMSLMKKLQGVRVINKETAKKLLTSIEEEEKNEDGLDFLLAGSQN